MTTEDLIKIGFEAIPHFTVTNSHKNPNLRFKFTNCFPTNLGQIDLDINVQDVAYATCSVTMRYDTMQMEQL